MDIFISHFWYIIGTFIGGLAVGMIYKDALLRLVSKAKYYFLRK